MIAEGWGWEVGDGEISCNNQTIWTNAKIFQFIIEVASTNQKSGNYNIVQRPDICSSVLLGWNSYGCNWSRGTQ